MTGRIQWQEHGAVGHVVPLVRKQEVMTGGLSALPPFFLFIQSRTPVHGMVLPRFKVALPSLG